MSKARGSGDFFGEQLAGEMAGERAAFEADLAAAGGEQVGLPIDLSDSDRHHSLPDAEEVLAIQDELDCDMAAAVREHRRRSGAGGRKKGSRNKRNDDFARYLLQFGPHPGITLMRIQGRPVELLAAELGCDKLAAAHLQARAASELMPFMESKMPVKADVALHGQVTWVEDRSGLPIDGGLVEGATGEPLLRLDGEMMENQQFDDGEEEGSE